MASSWFGGRRSKMTNRVVKSNELNHCNGATSNGIEKLSVATTEMCFFCFDVLISHLNHLEPPKMPAFTNNSYPLFVTWKTGNDFHLRGCIGTFNATPLHSGLREYAVTSAMKDSRFQPMRIDEVSRLHCSVSLLLHFEKCRDALDWQIGVHGIRIEFKNERGHHKTATYLPEVSKEQGWNQLQTVENLLRKGGYRSNITPAFLQTVTVNRYRTEKITRSYQDYLVYRGGNGVRMPHPHHHKPYPTPGQPVMHRRPSKEKNIPPSEHIH